MKSKIYLQEKDFAELVEREIANTAASRTLDQLIKRRMAADLSLALAGELDEDTYLTLSALKQDLRERATGISRENRKLADDVFDSYLKLAASQLKSDSPSDDAIADSIIAVTTEVQQRLGKILLDIKDARFTVVNDTGTFKDMKADKDADIIIAASNDLPKIPAPEDLFPNAGPEASIVTWKLRETVHQIHCEQETDEWGDDDIVLNGAYRWLGKTSRLNINPDEKAFKTGTSKFYDSAPQPTPHAEVILPDQGQFLPLFYLSSHLLVEADDLDSIVKAIASFVGSVIESPLSSAAGAAAGQLGVTGAGVAGGVVGGILDSVLDWALDGMITTAAANARRIIFDTFKGINAGSNIVFQPWITGVMITWVPAPGGGPRQPRWKVRHSIGKRSWDAKPLGQNPKVGQGILSPGRFAGDTHIVLLPELWDRSSDPTTPDGKYWYMSHIDVYREVYNPN